MNHEYGSLKNILFDSGYKTVSHTISHIIKDCNVLYTIKITCAIGLGFSQGFGVVQTDNLQKVNKNTQLRLTLTGQKGVMVQVRVAASPKLMYGGPFISLIT